MTATGSRNRPVAENASARTNKNFKKKKSALADLIYNITIFFFDSSFSRDLVSMLSTYRMSASFSKGRGSCCISTRHLTVLSVIVNAIAYAIQ